MSLSAFRHSCVDHRTQQTSVFHLVDLALPILIIWLVRQSSYVFGNKTYVALISEKFKQKKSDDKRIKIKT